MKRYAFHTVCATLKNRGGFTGKYEDLIENIRQFFDEAAYQLCDGYAVNMKYFSVYPNVGGTFNKTTEMHDHKKHPISFRFRTGNPLRRLTRHIAIDIEGLADITGWIDEFIDVGNDSINGVFEPGSQFILHGNKIKVAGEDPKVGIYFVPVDDPSKAQKVTKPLAENTQSKIIGIIPKSTGFQFNRVEIRTQFTGSTATMLKTPRIITSAFVLEEA